MKIDRITFSVERTLNMGNYESVKVRAEFSGTTSDVKEDMKQLKKMVYKEIDKESSSIYERYGNGEEE